MPIAEASMFGVRGGTEFGQKRSNTEVGFWVRRVTRATAISLYVDRKMHSKRIIRAMGLTAVSSLLSACAWDLPGSFHVDSVEGARQNFCV